MVTSAFFPYATLFRSGGVHLLVGGLGAAVGDVGADGVGEQERLLEHHAELPPQLREPQRRQRHATEAQLARRSEEHTSELQSPCNLVRRLLLEKKKRN